MKDALTEIADLRKRVAELEADLEAARCARVLLVEALTVVAHEARRRIEAIQRDANIALEQRRAAEAHAEEWRQRYAFEARTDYSADDWACG